MASASNILGVLGPFLAGLIMDAYEDVNQAYKVVFFIDLLW